MEQEELKDLLEELHERYNRVDFIACDPISVPHSFSRKEDIEIAGFFAAIMAWGQRSQIIKNANLLMDLMDRAPFDFVHNASKKDLSRLDKFYYRTLKSVDVCFFIEVLKRLYRQSSLEILFSDSYKRSGDLKDGLITLHSYFLGCEHQQRSMKHIANAEKGSSAKRLNMFLRWMIRSDIRGVDFGIWENIPASALYIPLDVHSGRVARDLEILKRKHNDWKAVVELTSNLRLFDPADPVKYDFALFGFGIDSK